MVSASFLYAEERQFPKFRNIFKKISYENK